MRKVAGYDQAVAFDGNFERMAPGGHVCQILNAVVQQNDRGDDMLVLLMDVREGSSYDDFYRREFDRKKSSNPNARWPCQYRQFTVTKDGSASSYFKGLIQAIEKSNPGYQWNWDEMTLRGKYVGMIFREEEFESSYGDIRTTVRPFAARSVETIRNGVEIPEKKPLTSRPTSAKPGFVEVNDDDLPF